MEIDDLFDHIEDRIKRRVPTSLRSLLVHFVEFRSQIGVALLFLLVAKFATILVPITLKSIVDWFDPALNSDGIYMVPILLIIALGLLALASTLFEELRSTLFSKVELQAVRKIGLQAFQHLHQLSHAFHQEQQTAGLSRDIENGIQGINRFLWYIAFDLVPTVFGIALTFIFLVFIVELKLVFIIAVIILAYFWITYHVIRWRGAFPYRSKTAEFRMDATSVDTLSNYETVKYFCNEEYECNQFESQMQEWEEQSIVSEQSLAFLNIGQAAIIAIGTIVLLSFAGRSVITNDLTLGGFIMLNAFLIQMYLPLRSLGANYQEVNGALMDMERMFELLSIDDKIPEAEEAQELNISNANIKFEKVGFAYLEDRQILKDVSFEVTSGQKIAVVGMDGAGKSTLLRLLFRFYDVTNGQILIDNQDIRNVSFQSLRSSVGVIPQEAVLFNKSIEYNIRYGAPDCTDSEFTAAVKAANLHEFIESLPQKHDTIVGEHGLKLSSGEMQRISIARTFLKDPPILVLDEPITPIDSNSQEFVQTELDLLAKNRTTLVIARRLSSVVDADGILVMDHGEIVERGTHAELLELNGLFADMWWLQQVEETADAQIAELAASISLDHS